MEAGPQLAFLSFGLAIPGASAKCFKDFSQALPASALSAAVAQSASSAAAQSDTIRGMPGQPFGGPSIVGLWNATFTSGGQTVDVAFDAWHDDGTEILNDYTNPIEGNVCLGVYEQTGPHSYKLKHPSWSFDYHRDPPRHSDHPRVGHSQPRWQRYKGTYAYDIYDTTGAFVTELPARSAQRASGRTEGCGLIDKSVGEANRFSRTTRFATERPRAPQ